MDNFCVIEESVQIFTLYYYYHLPVLDMALNCYVVLNLSIAIWRYGSMRCFCFGTGLSSMVLLAWNFWSFSLYIFSNGITALSLPTCQWLVFVWHSLHGADMLFCLDYRMKFGISVCEAMMKLGITPATHGSTTVSECKILTWLHYVCCLLWWMQW